LSVSLVDFVWSRRGDRVIHGVTSVVVVVVVGLLDCEAGEDIEADVEEEHSAKTTAAAGEQDETDDMDDDDDDDDTEDDDDDDVRAVPSSVVGGLLDREADVDTGADVASKCSSMLKQIEESG